MKKNLSTINLTGQPHFTTLSVRGITSPQNSNLKKIQGFDKSATVDMFTSKIEKIKNKPKKENLEDMYVKGLQDQIHYLQMQLKLLKEKEIAKHSQVDQLETFFGDGIPINQNILAMKNGFNNYKVDQGKKITDLEIEKNEREGVIKSLSSKVAEISKEIHHREKQFKDSLTYQSDITHQKVKKQALLKQQIKTQDQNLRVLKGQNRKLLDVLGGMQRAKQILMIAMLKIESNKLNKLNKLKESIGEKEIEFNDLLKKYEQMKKQQQQKSYVIKVQEDNLKTKKKIISLEKQLNSLKIKAEQKKMELDAKLKDRHKEILARMSMQMRYDSLKDEIDRENGMSVEDLQKNAKQKEAQALETIVNKNKKLSKYIDYYGNLQAKVQDNLHQFGEKKPQLKRQLEAEQNLFKVLSKQLQKQKQTQYETVSQIEKYKSKSSHIDQIVPPTIQIMKKQQDKIKTFKIQRERLIQQIQIKEKQVQLIQMLKSLNLEESLISNSSNSSIQDRLIDFMRSWETLNRG